MLKIILLIVFNLFFINQINSARILGVFSHPSPSHFRLAIVLLKNLALKGHNITMISPFAVKESIPNYNEIILSDSLDKWQDYRKELMVLQKFSRFEQFVHACQSLIGMTEESLSNSKVQNLLKSNEQYDLVIMNNILSEAHTGFAHHYNCPLLLLNSINSHTLLDHYLYTPAPSSYVPQLFTGFTENMNFFERMENFLLTCFIRLVTYWYHLPKQNEILHKYFPDAPYITEVMQKRISLILSNSHSSFNVPRPMVPNMIEIGGFHIQDVKPLPEELKNYLDQAAEGFILFSLGSNFKSKNLNIEVLNIFIEVFNKLPYKILWKFEADQLENKPNNVRIEKWLPQNDILAHPNLKLFITHGGLLSTTEAIYHGVPLVGIPLVVDQRLNMAYTQKLGIGKTVDFNDLSYDNLLSAIQEVINNKKYQEKSRERSKILRDQPLRPIDNAVYWVEYALRYKYVDHFKTGAQLLNWYQIDCLDVIAVIGGVIFFIIFIVFLMIRKLCLFKQTITNKVDKEKKL